MQLFGWMLITFHLCIYNVVILLLKLVINIIYWFAIDKNMMCYESTSSDDMDSQTEADKVDLKPWKLWTVIRGIAINPAV